MVLESEACAFITHQGRPHVAGFLQAHAVDATVVFVCGPEGVRRAASAAAHALNLVVVAHTFEL